MKTLTDIEVLEGVKVLVRADFNVPMRNGVIEDGFRIKSTLPTIDYLRSKGAKVILISHLESIDGSNQTLKPVADELIKMGEPVVFVKDFKKAHEILEVQIKNGDCVLLENLRFFEGEKANDTHFAQELASFADIYVNDAFSVSHREHASIVGIPKFLPSYAGIQFEKEVAALSKVFNPAHPFLFILGGAKFETKLPLLQKFMNIADTIFVGGALANDFYKAKGYEIGTSLVSKGNLPVAEFVASSKVLLPVDVLNQHNEAKPADGVLKIDKILDSGPQTLEMLKAEISKARCILWNGPLGLYEEGYKSATLGLARLISEATAQGIETIVGGGDTLAAIAEGNLQDTFTFISTGGGAMLDFLAKGTLPGIEALNASEI